jgi:hypothetical protein
LARAVFFNRLGELRDLTPLSSTAHSDVERRRWCGDQPLSKIAESGNNHHVGDSLPFFREKGESVPVGQSMTADAPEHAGFRDAGKRDLDDRP